MNNIAVFGTASDVGKSVIATAFCRIFSDAGIDVAPFKAQNMSNNSGVTPDGCEIGRAQIAQAEAARVVPTADMNPVLLKPNTDTGAQVVLQGRAVANRSAREYFGNTKPWRETAFQSLGRLQQQHELLVIEGAGACAEMNLYERDFVNFKTAHAADASVILVADIDRGGVFAQVVGTMAVLPEEDRQLVSGVVINRFRGDVSLFRDGVRMLEERSGLPVLGVIPYFQGISIDSEDAVLLQTAVDPPRRPDPARVSIAVIRLPHISNFTDVAALEREEGAEVHYLSRLRSLDGYQAVVLPGSKNVRGDLVWLEKEGWGAALQDFRRNGGSVVGICGGYQMLGIDVADPYGVEGEPGVTCGLGMLPVRTVLQREKTLCNAAGVMPAAGCRVHGYEIHMGETVLEEGATTLFDVLNRNGRETSAHDGAISLDRHVFGTYFHGVFDASGFRNWFLQSLDGTFVPAEDRGDREDEYNRLAQHVSEHLDMEKLWGIVNGEW
ncbi:cobyric acid synthase [Prosthecochloris sp. N3]|uniref:Cobyric acid synthase n=1 Tax=Prosthecochloris ethylica TaxID=2743976 RepID=A0ABR9XTY5_9CHLB|nr:cobyric acid synthase [Prosthecochloris ethylica]MBF0587122.1 cobyric acid synthase [Prosthecochloris ethylica]MBF0637424.1 cobyric acid synthase [Prosthecochloris ethylica]NUK48064.1 cobyric acid synthase [Prosthecochloris ethylica]